MQFISFNLNFALIFEKVNKGFSECFVRYSYITCFVTASLTNVLILPFLPINKDSVLFVENLPGLTTSLSP